MLVRSAVYLLRGAVGARSFAESGPCPRGRGSDSHHLAHCLEQAAVRVGKLIELGEVVFTFADKIRLVIFLPIYRYESVLDMETLVFLFANRGIERRIGCRR